MELEDFDIRYTTPDDEPYLRKWVLDPSVLMFFPMETEKEIDDAIKAWMGFAKYEACLTATVQGIPCGMAALFLMPYRKVAHHSLFKIVVDPSFQKKGVGTDLIRNLKHLAKTRFKLEMLFIDVFEDNPLLHLLEKRGFSVYGVEKGYVRRKDRTLSKMLLECDLYRGDL